jgi:carboxypeptidase C (cathepsin A)
MRCLLQISSTLLALLLAACGGGGGGGDAPPGPVGGLDDPSAYSSQPTASLPGAVEAAAVTAQRITLGGREIAYTATAGHLIARDPVAGAAQASIFYVAYTADATAADPARRPVTFFYNGGPGSASVWLHLGSFGPKRLVTGVPATTAARPFPLVDNADSLLDTTDLVFVNAVGSGRSQAIAPYRNQDFWGVDADAALFRDAIRRWLALNGREASPFFLYGESYGGPRTAVLARRLQEAGLKPAGLVLQSPALDYNSNCGVSSSNSIACTGYLPSYAAAGAWHRLTKPVLADTASDAETDAWVAGARDYAATTYAPAVQAWLSGKVPAPQLWQPLADLTGLPAAQWQASFNLGPQIYRERLIEGQLIGRYDARMRAPVGSALAAEGDPSSTWITSSFGSAIDAYLRDTLGYRNASTYVLLSNAIQTWDFSHDGRALPDTVPDLAAALAADPALRVLAVSGLHDLATPFNVTETDLARLGSDRVSVRNYPGGHMSFLDDGTRPRQKADLVAFMTAALAAAPVRRAPLAARPLPLPDRAGAPLAAAAGLLQPEPAMQAPMRDPWVPPR